MTTLSQTSPVPSNRMSLYMRDIGQFPLLSREEEIAKFKELEEAKPADTLVRNLKDKNNLRMEEMKRWMENAKLPAGCKTVKTENGQIP